MSRDIDRDPDILGLKWILEGCEKSTPRMRKASLEYAWDRYIVHPRKAVGVTAPKQGGGA